MNKYEIAITALQKIANPTMHLQDRAKALGHGVNGNVLAKLADDPNYLKSIAEDALRDIKLLDRKK